MGKSHIGCARSERMGAMASQTRRLMASISPEIFAMEVAEEAFVDASHPAVRSRAPGSRSS